MPIILDRQLKEQIPREQTGFPVTYFHDELLDLPNWQGPLHWHPDFEIATCKDNTLDFQVGQEHIILYSGDSIFINRNILHSIRQVSGGVPDSMPNIVFFGRIIAPETDDVYKKYIQPIADCHSLPFVVFSAQNTGNDMRGRYAYRMCISGCSDNCCMFNKAFIC